jgi:flagellar hook assembly protein FlgD
MYYRWMAFSLIFGFFPGNPERAKFTIPPELYADSTITVKLEKLTGERVTLSVLKIYQYEKGDTLSGGPMSSGTTVPSKKPILKVKPTIFRNEVVIEFMLPQDGRVKMCVYDVTGKRVATLLDRLTEAGNYSFRWNGKDNGENILPVGVYFIRLNTPVTSLTKKVILLR